MREGSVADCLGPHRQRVSDNWVAADVVEIVKLEVADLGIPMCDKSDLVRTNPQTADASDLEVNSENNSGTMFCGLS